MKKIFEELWSGAMGFDPESRGLSAREKAVMKRLATLRDELQAGVSAEQREKLTQLDEGYAELMAVGEQEAFFYAFCLGARLVMGIMESGELLGRSEK